MDLTAKTQPIGCVFVFVFVFVFVLVPDEGRAEADAFRVDA
ncbi:hypothetical protein ACSZMC_08320 [Aeromonas jandaei]